VLIQKTKPEWQKDKLNGLGGKIEAGEYPYQAMRREFEEECGLDVPSWTQYATMRSGQHVIHVFKAEINPTVSPHAFKQTDEGWVSLYYWPSAIRLSYALPNLSWLIPLARMESGVRADIFYPHDPLEKK
jgi:8-oxo-dGTP diphosphatase